MTNDDRKLNEILANSGSCSDEPCRTSSMQDCGGASPVAVANTQEKFGGLTQWTTHDGKRFFPASQTAQKITPGVYEIQMSPNAGIYFERINVVTENLLRFPQTNSEKVVQEIQRFWEKEAVFKEYGLLHKRGIIMWGPPGSGKSCTIKLIMKDVVDRNGIVVKFTHPEIFNDGMRKFREIEPNTPVVVLMEDIDSILRQYNQSEVLNILDGINQIEKAVFLATTNYPEELGARIINRPSRFDKRFFIGHPNEESRKMYFKHIIGEKKIAELKLDIDQWVADTEEFSIAHLQELFKAVVILGDKYDDAVETLTTMREEFVSSKDDEKPRPIGFAAQGQKMAKYARSSPLYLSPNKGYKNEQ